VSNEVTTTKYTWWNFIPKNLFEQFTGKLANVFFLFVIFMETQPSVSVSGGKPVTMVPLIFVVMISMVKDAFEDCKRCSSDKEANGLHTEIYNQEKREFEKDKTWADIKVGDFVKIDKEQKFIPCDLLVIQSEGVGGTCGVETKNLDGETNLKFRQVPEGLLSAPADLHTLHSSF